MESNLIINAEEEKILNELKNIYGTEKCIDVLKNYISFVNLKERQKENFANARCVRNLFEKIKFEQADRVAKNEKDDLNLIKKCDIENVINRIEIKETEKFKIGFAC